MGIKLPNDVTKLSADALADLLTQAQTEFDALLALDEPNDADVTEAERLDPIIKSLTAESARRTTAAAELSARMDALRTAPTEPDPDPGPADPSEPTTPAPPSTVADGAPEVVEISPTLYAEDLVQAADESDTKFAERQSRYPHRDLADGQQVVQVNPGQLATTANPAQVQVISQPPATTTADGFVRQIAGKVARPQVPGRNRGAVVIRASADVPEYATGSVLEDLTTVAKATLSRMQGFPAWAPPAQETVTASGEKVYDLRQFGVATFRKPFGDDLIAPANGDAYETIMNASRESNLPGQSLTAAGGWCAPSEVIYDLCQDETTDGMLSIPEIQVSRGGIKYTQGPDFSTIYNNVGFCQTEAQAIAGTPKPCYEVPCPSFTEVRLDACGICIKVPILTQAGYPELVARVISGSMIAHQHKMNAKVIAALATALGAAVAMPDIKSSAQGTLNAVGLVAETLRSQYRLGFNRAMEVVAPHWLLGAIKADLSFRTGVDFRSISDAEVNAALTAAGAAVQWVEDWQPLPAGCPTGWPATVDLLVYPSGTFVKGVSDIIRLNAVYDAASLAVNEYTGLFFEEGILVARTCYSGCAVTIPLCQAGTTGAASNADCYTSGTP